jgi:hypothetical protein
LIVTDCNIVVDNGKSTADKNIIVYRGDFNIQVTFSITQNDGYSYLSSSNNRNLITSTNASYAQMIVKLQNSDDIIILTEAEPTEDGKVTLTIIREYIDELVEVGAYDYQIRLFSGDKQARITIPPVEGQLIVKSPIMFLDDSATINLASIDSAVLLEGLEEEDLTFDSNGAYNKSEWLRGSVITESKMNKIEDALYQINEKSSNCVSKDETPFRTVADQTITRSGQLDGAFKNGFYLVKNTIIKYDGGQLALDNELVRVRSYRGETPLGEDRITELYLYKNPSTYKFYTRPLVIYLLETTPGTNGLEHYVTKEELITGINMPDIIEIRGEFVTSNYFSEADYNNGLCKTVLFNNAVFAGNNRNGELVRMTLGWDEATSTRTITISSILGETEFYSVQADDSLILENRKTFTTEDTINSMLGKRNYATQDYVDEAVANIEGGGTGSGLDIMTIGDGKKVYKFTGNEFTKEEYGTQWEGDVFLNDVRIGDWTYNEIVKIHCLFGAGILVDDQYIEGDVYSIYTKKGIQCYIIDKYREIHFIKSFSGDYISNTELSKYGIITDETLSNYGYATKDELNTALGNIEDLLGGI